MFVRKTFRSKTKPKKEVPAHVTSTPNGTGALADTPDVSIIEPTCSSPVLISAESLEDLETEFLEQLHVSPMCLGAAVVQRAGHGMLHSNADPNTPRRLQRPLGKPPEPNQVIKTPYMQRLAKELQKSVNIVNKKPKPDLTSPTANINPSNPNTMIFTRPCTVAVGKIAKSASPFKENFALQTFDTATKRTSPFQIPTRRLCNKTTSPSNCTQSSDNLNLTATCHEVPKAIRSIPSFSCPSSPRERARPCAHSRSRSQSPPPSSQEPILGQGLTSALKDIIGKITSSFLTGESKLPEVACVDTTQARRCDRCVHFTQGETRADTTSTGIGDLQELYFNKDIKSCDPYKKNGNDPIEFPPWVQLARPYSNNEDPSLTALGQRQATIPSVSTHSSSSQPVVFPCGVCLSKPSLGCRGKPSPCLPPAKRNSCMAYQPQPCPPQPCPPQPCQPQSCPPQPCQPLPCQPQPPCRQPPSCPYKQDTLNTSGLCEAKRLQQMQKQLLATQLCLKNKEDTVRVQADSLTCAEQRIAMLTLRAAQQRVQLESMQRELCKARKACQGPMTINCDGTTEVCCEMPSVSCCNADVCCQSDPRSEVDYQKNLVKTLQNNLMVIEELYRQCFYETAKQEELIEKLRQSYLDVRLMEKEKADRIGRLENVVNAQKWSLEACQGVAMEVETLKAEILNFLNNSNNDSGMWEQSLAGEVGEDITDIMQQLHQLREMLQDDCNNVCVLKTEIENLKRLNQCLECKVQTLCQEKRELDYAIACKEDIANSLQRENDSLRRENDSLKKEIEEMSAKIKAANEVEEECDSIKKRLNKTQCELKEAVSEVCCLRNACRDLQQKNACLNEELEKADDIIKEDCKIRSEVQYLTQQVDLWRAQLAQSEERVRCGEMELERVRSHCRAIDQCYREKVEAAAALETQLQEAHTRGAQLCAESRRVVCTVRNWIRRMQCTNEENSLKIKELECVITTLQKKLQQQMSESGSRSRSGSCGPCGPCVFCVQTQPTPDRNTDQTPYPTIGCSKCAAKRPTDPSRSPTDDSDDVVVGCSKCAPKRHNSTQGYRSEITVDFQIGCSKCAPKRRINNEETESGSGTSQSTNVTKGSGCEREHGATQVVECRPESGGVVPTCSHIPVPPRRLLRKKLYSDRVTHFLRCTASAARGEVGVQEPARSDTATSPRVSPLACVPHRFSSRIPRAVSPTSELLERVSRLNDAMEESQSRWSRTKLPQPQRERR